MAIPIYIGNDCMWNIKLAVINFTFYWSCVVITYALCLDYKISNFWMSISFDNQEISSHLCMPKCRDAYFYNRNFTLYLSVILFKNCKLNK